MQDIAGSEVTLSLPADSVAGDVLPALTVLDNRFDGAEQYARLAVNEEWANPDQPLTEGEIVALIPPVSGG